MLQEVPRAIITLQQEIIQCVDRQAVKWVLWYLRVTSDVGLVQGKTSKTHKCVVGYVDSNYAGDLDKRRSLTSYVFTLSSSVISWKAN